MNFYGTGLSNCNNDQIFQSTKHFKVSFERVWKEIDYIFSMPKVEHND